MSINEIEIRAIILDSSKVNKPLIGTTDEEGSLKMCFRCVKHHNKDSLNQFDSSNDVLLLLLHHASLSSPST